MRQKLLELLGTFNVQGKQIHDANHVATMLENGIQAICTLNRRDFMRYQRRKIIKIEEPRADPG